MLRGLFYFTLLHHACSELIKNSDTQLHVLQRHRAAKSQQQIIEIGSSSAPPTPPVQPHLASASPVPSVSPSVQSPSPVAAPVPTVPSYPPPAALLTPSSEANLACNEIELGNFSSTTQSYYFWDLNTTYFKQNYTYNGRPVYRSNSFQTFIFFASVQVRKLKPVPPPAPSLFPVSPLFTYPPFVNSPNSYEVTASPVKYWVFDDVLREPANPIVAFSAPNALTPMDAPRPITWSPALFGQPYLKCYTAPPPMDPATECPIIEFKGTNFGGTEAFNSLYYYRDPKGPKPTTVSTHPKALQVPSTEPLDVSVYSDHPVYDELFGSKIFYAGSNRLGPAAQNLHGWALGTHLGFDMSVLLAHTDTPNPSQVPQGRWSGEIIGAGPMPDAIAICHKTAPWNPDPHPYPRWGGGPGFVGASAAGGPSGDPSSPSPTPSGGAAGQLEQQLYTLSTIPRGDCGENVDVIIALDCSGSMSGAEVAEARSFVRNVAARILGGNDYDNSTDAKHTIRLGLVTFAQFPATLVPLTASFKEFSAPLDRFNRFEPWLGTATATGDTLELMEQMFNASGRADSYRVYFVLTDGEETYPAISSATLPRKYQTVGTRLLKDAPRSRVVPVLYTEGMPAATQRSLLARMATISTDPRGAVVIPSFSLLRAETMEAHVANGICAINESSVDCGLSGWLPWGECSQKCGGGVRSRVRFVISNPTANGKSCESAGNLTDSEVCNVDPCAVDCEVSAWSTWSDCPTPCHDGLATQRRTRTVIVEPKHGGAACGPLVHETACEPRPCPVDCNYTDWGVPADRYGIVRDADGWEPCVGACRDDAYQIRRRAVYSQPLHGGAACPPLYERRACLELPACDEQCPPPGQWEPYGPCLPCTDVPHSPLCEHHSSEAGTGAPRSASAVSESMCDGVIVRRRVGAPPPSLVLGAPALACHMDEEHIPCPLPSRCPVDCVVSEWHVPPCGVPCGEGTVAATRGVLRLASGGGDACPPLSEERTCTTDIACDYGCETSTWRDVVAADYPALLAMAAAWDATHTPNASGGASAALQIERAVLTPTMVDIMSALTAAHTPSPGSLTPAPGAGDAVEVTAADARRAGIAGCSRSCGGGMVVQLRTIVSGRPPPWVLGPCPALLQNSSCNPEPCPVDCRVGQWSEWGVCSSTCGGGKANRTRAVTEPAAYGGAACPVLTEYTECNDDPCPQDCKVGGFGEFTDCSERCGGGHSRRVRSMLVPPLYGGEPCPPLEEVVECNVQPCTPTPLPTFTPSEPPPPPVDCYLSPPEPSGNCSAACGDGTQMFTVKVLVHPLHGGTPCPSQLYELRPCTGTQCTRHCEVTEWSEWSQCDATCGGGLMHRYREVNQTPTEDGRECPAVEDASACNTDPCPVDCVVVWRDSPCSITCGDAADGTVTRVADVLVQDAYGGLPCPHVLVETAPCTAALPPCPQNCVVSEWGELGECIGSCDPPVGTTSRYRSIISEGTHGGLSCAAIDMVDSESCVPPTCPPCIYSEWVGESCPSGDACGDDFNVTALRTVKYGIADECIDTTKVVPCDLPPCAPMCTNETWSDWTPCSNTDCGVVGYRTRVQRFADASCPTMTESQPCFTACVSTCSYSAWGPWSACSAQCGSGTRKRTRVVTAAPSGGVGECTETHQEEPCTLPACSQTCTAGPWGEWSACSVQCGGGTRTRVRTLTRPSDAAGDLACPPAVELSACSVTPCTRECSVSAWGAWGQCLAVTCGGGGTRSRHRTITHYGYGTSCPPLTETAACAADASACRSECLFGPWSAWGACSSACGGGLRRRTRELLHGGGNASTCTGTSEEEPCAVHDCPVDCVLGPWDNWHGCTAGCDGQRGTELRTRSIVQPAAFGGRECEDPVVELRECVAADVLPCAPRAEDDSAYTPWPAWGSCMRACGGGWRERARAVAPGVDVPIGTAMGVLVDYEACSFGSAARRATAAAAADPPPQGAAAAATLHVATLTGLEAGLAAAVIGRAAPMAAHAAVLASVEDDLLTTDARGARALRDGVVLDGAAVMVLARDPVARRAAMRRQPRVAHAATGGTLADPHVDAAPRSAHGTAPHGHAPHSRTATAAAVAKPKTAAARRAAAADTDVIEFSGDCGVPAQFTEWRNITQCTGEYPCVSPRVVGTPTGGGHLVSSRHVAAGSFAVAASPPGAARRVAAAAASSLRGSTDHLSSRRARSAQDYDAAAALTRVLPCALPVCDAASCVVSPWSQWSSCDPCRGTRRRVRVTVYPQDAGKVAAAAKGAAWVGVVEGFAVTPAGAALVPFAGGPLAGVERCRGDDSEDELCVPGAGEPPCSVTCNTTAWVRTGECVLSHTLGTPTAVAVVPTPSPAEDTSCSRPGTALMSRFVIRPDPVAYRLANCSTASLSKLEPCTVLDECCVLSGWMAGPCELRTTASPTAPHRSAISDISTAGTSAAAVPPASAVCGPGVRRYHRAVSGSSNSANGVRCSVIPASAGGTAPLGSGRDALVSKEEPCEVPCPSPVPVPVPVPVPAPVPLPVAPIPVPVPQAAQPAPPTPSFVPVPLPAHVASPQPPTPTPVQPLSVGPADITPTAPATPHVPESAPAQKPSAPRTSATATPQGGAAAVAAPAWTRSQLVGVVAVLVAIAVIALAAIAIDQCVRARRRAAIASRKEAIFRGRSAGVRVAGGEPTGFGVGGGMDGELLEALGHGDDEARSPRLHMPVRPLDLLPAHVVPVLDAFHLDLPPQLGAPTTVKHLPATLTNFAPGVPPAATSAARAASAMRYSPSPAGTVAAPRPADAPSSPARGASRHLPASPPRGPSGPAPPRADSPLLDDDDSDDSDDDIADDDDDSDDSDEDPIILRK